MSNQNNNNTIHNVLMERRFRNLIQEMIEIRAQRENNLTNYMRIVGQYNEQDALNQAIEISYNAGVQEAVMKKKKLSKEEYDDVVSVRSAKKTDRDPSVTCSICQEGYKTHKIAKLPCGHEFHNTCSGKWLKKYGSDCPLCKTSVVQE